MASGDVGGGRAHAHQCEPGFHSRPKPLRALPYAGDDLDVTMNVLGELAERDGVTMHLPQLWQRADPWA